jgi:hypothetical protein
MVQVQKKSDENGNQVVDEEPFIDERKPLSTSAVKGNLNNDDHTLIPVTVKMIHSAVRDCDKKTNTTPQLYGERTYQKLFPARTKKADATPQLYGILST